MKKRIAIVSSYNEECGAAFYSLRLKMHFEAAGYAVDIKRLPVSLLRMNAPTGIRRKGDAEIQRIATEIRDYDAVLLQFEPGLYGSTAKTSLRRVTRLLSAAKNVVLTVHGFDRQISLASSLNAVGYLARLQGANFVNEVDNLLQYSLVTKFWRHVRQSKHIKVLTFCKADQTFLERLYDLPLVSNYPITYYGREEVDHIRSTIDRDQFLTRYGLDPQKKYFAVCGFLSGYKGHMTAMKALEFLPDDWNLAIVGGEHPHGLEAGREIGRYIGQLLAFATEEERLDAVPGFPATNRLPFVGSSADANRLDIRNALFERSDFKYFLPKSEISKRVSFLGQVSDDDMPKFYAALDYAVHPYMRTRSGQSGSGPATLALEFGTRALFTNAPVFREMSHYFPDAMQFFNVGNFIELADSLQRFDRFEERLNERRVEALKTYNPAGMVEAYRTLLEA